jgi:hypothetical protein
LESDLTSSAVVWRTTHAAATRHLREGRGGQDKDVGAVQKREEDYGWWWRPRGGGRSGKRWWRRIGKRWATTADRENKKTQEAAKNSKYVTIT